MACNIPSACFSIFSLVFFLRFHFHGRSNRDNVEKRLFRCCGGDFCGSDGVLLLEVVIISCSVFKSPLALGTHVSVTDKCTCADNSTTPEWSPSTSIANSDFTIGPSCTVYFFITTSCTQETSSSRVPTSQFTVFVRVPMW